MSNLFDKIDLLRVFLISEVIRRESEDRLSLGSMINLSDVFSNEILDLGF